jgi:uncharacterized surface protein with fasciclin (FAS1) repeats
MIMKMKSIPFLATAISCVMMIACNNSETKNDEAGTTAPENNSAVQAASGGQMNVEDNSSGANIVKVAVGSNDHTILVKALQAADLVNAMSNNGPFTVFAPTNAAFDALPKGTLDDLMQPEKKDALTAILYHHVQVAVYKTENLHDGQVLTMFDGTPATIHVKDGKYSIDDANILASIPATNGIVHVIDKVLLPPVKK